MDEPDKLTPEDSQRLSAMLILLEKHKPTLEWASMCMEREKRRAEMWRKIGESVLGHIVWVSVVGIGAAVWQYVKHSLRD
jgi:hypothetical protein